MKKWLKLSIYVLIFGILVFGFFSNRATILGRVIDFSQTQEERGNVYSILFISIFFIGGLILLFIMDYLGDYYRETKEKKELDELISRNQRTKW